jgi:RNA polymerase sigma-70 factor, ECF subfamily
MIGSTPMAIDEALVASVRRNDEAAFTALYQRHSPYIAGVVYRLLGDDAELDDIVQETFVAAARHLDSLVNASALRAWLVSIAVRRVHKQLSARRRRRFVLSNLFDLVARSSDPEDRRQVDELYDALDRLPVDLRVPWSLHRIEELSLPEVALACGVSLSTVKRRIADAEQRLDRRLQR